MAGASTSRSRMDPCSSRSRVQAPNAPGTTAGTSPVPGILSTPIAFMRAMVAALGAVPWPHSTRGRSRPAGCTMIGTSPPGPFRCGSTIWSVRPVATAASNALPPFSRIPNPTAVAIQWVLATAPNVPRISGRVVNAWPTVYSSGMSTCAASGLPASRSMICSVTARSRIPQGRPERGIP